MHFLGRPKSKKRSVNFDIFGISDKFWGPDTQIAPKLCILGVRRSSYMRGKAEIKLLLFKKYPNKKDTFFLEKLYVEKKPKHFSKKKLNKKYIKHKKNVNILFIIL